MVTYDVRYGPADIVEHGVNGFLVPSGDIDVLAERVVQVLQDPGLARSLRAGCARTQDRFVQHAFAARWFALFRPISAGSAPTPSSRVR